MFSNWIVAMGAPNGAGGGMSGIFTLVWFALIFVVMYLLLIRPQQKKAKEHKRLLDELKKLDMNALSPIEALNRLYEWQRKYLETHSKSK